MTIHTDTPNAKRVGFVLGNLRATGELLQVRTAGLLAVLSVGALTGTRADASVTVGLITAATVAIGVVEAVQRSRVPQEA